MIECANVLRELRKRGIPHRRTDGARLIEGDWRVCRQRINGGSVRRIAESIREGGCGIRLPLNDDRWVVCHFVYLVLGGCCLLWELYLPRMVEGLRLVVTC